MIYFNKDGSNDQNMHFDNNASHSIYDRKSQQQLINSINMKVIFLVCFLRKLYSLGNTNTITITIIQQII